MQIINYKFVDGTIKSIEVEEKFYEEYEKLEIETKRLNRKETRRHISINIFEEQGVEFKDDSSNLEDLIINKENEQRVISAIKKLNQKQQNLVQKVFYDNKSLTEIAKEENVSKSAITQQMKVIYRKLKEILKNF